MPNLRFATDGLWHCLCPSFDSAVLSRPLLLSKFKPRPCAANLDIKQCLRPPTQPRRQIQTHSLAQGFRSNRGGWARDLEYKGRRQADVEPQTDAHVYRTANRELYGLEELVDLPVEQIHDILRLIRSDAGAFGKISSLVSHLTKLRGQKPCLLYYDALIRANSDAEFGSAETVELLLDDMGSQGIIADSSLLHGVLQVLAIHPNHLLRTQVLREMKDRWFELSLEGWHNLVVGLLRDRQYEAALEKLSQMHEENLRVQPWLYDIIIYLLCEAKELDEALRILRYRVEVGEGEGVVASNVWYHMLDICSANYHYAGALYIWQKRISGSHLHPSDGTLTNMLSMAARCHDSALATDVVRILTSRTSKLEVHHYESLLAAYARSGDLKTSFRILCIMKKAQLEPDEGATRPIYQLLLGSGVKRLKDTAPERYTEDKNPQDAVRMLEELLEDGHIVPVAAMNVILSVAIHKERLSVSIEFYKKIHTLCRDGPDISTFNCLLSACSKAEERIPEYNRLSSTEDVPDVQPGYGKATAMFLASEMLATKVRPNLLSYDRLILTCLADQLNPRARLDNSGFHDAMLYLKEARDMYGARPVEQREVSGTVADNLSLLVKLDDNWRGTPLRRGTWITLVKHAADLGDERVWELLNEMEAMGEHNHKLKPVVREMWLERRRRAEGLSADEAPRSRGGGKRGRGQWDNFLDSMNM